VAHKTLIVKTRISQQEAKHDQIDHEIRARVDDVVNVEQTQNQRMGSSSKSGAVDRHLRRMNQSRVSAWTGLATPHHLVVQGCQKDRLDAMMQYGLERFRVLGDDRRLTVLEVIELPRGRILEPILPPKDEHVTISRVTRELTKYGCKTVDVVDETENGPWCIPHMESKPTFGNLLLPDGAEGLRAISGTAEPKAHSQRLTDSELCGVEICP
jgi:hypothetical protein